MPTSADYDARIFDFREKDRTVSLTLFGCREHIPVVLANYQSGKLKERNPTSAQLCKHRDGLFYIHIQLTAPTSTPETRRNVDAPIAGRSTSYDCSWSTKQFRQGLTGLLYHLPTPAKPVMSATTLG